MTDSVDYLATMPGAEFALYLGRHNLNDANAARVFGVSYGTIKNWQRTGLSGASAQFVKLLIIDDIPPYFVAKRLGIALSELPRGGYRRGHPALPVKVDVPPARNYVAGSKG
jgi:hypothetical protein